MKKPLIPCTLCSVLGMWLQDYVTMILSESLHMLYETNAEKRSVGIVLCPTQTHLILQWSIRAC